MFTKAMKCVSIAVLGLAVLGLPATGLQVPKSLVCVAALLVVTQAVRANKYPWAVGFTVIAVLFNPIVPLAFSRQTFLWLYGVCLVAFLASLLVLKREPTLSMPSITGRSIVRP